MSLKMELHGSRLEMEGQPNQNHGLKLPLKTEKLNSLDLLM